MKTIRTDINAIMTDVKIIGNIDLPKSNPLCLVSEKNLKVILKNLGTISAGDTARGFANSVIDKSTNMSFNVKTFQEMLNEEIENIQFLVDCGDLLIGDDSKIKEFLGGDSKCV